MCVTLAWCGVGIDLGRMSSDTELLGDAFLFGFSLGLPNKINKYNDGSSSSYTFKYISFKINISYVIQSLRQIRIII